LGLLLEAVQDIDSFLELGHEHHAEDALGVADANLTCTSADLVEWFPVRGVKASLNFAKLEACFFARSLRKSKEIVVSGADPPDFFLFFAGFYLYKILYNAIQPVNVPLWLVCSQST
jgi:hypothetical protein